MEHNIDHIHEESVRTQGPSAVVVLGPRALIGIILLSLIAGMGGGVYGALNLAGRPGVQKFFGSSVNSTSPVNQNLVLTEESSITNVVHQTSSSVVSIIISKDLSRIPSFGFDPFGFSQQGNSNTQPGLQEVGAGTGFFVSGDGLILTNKHVVSDEKASYTVVTSDGKTYDAQVVSRDPVNDLAIVKVSVSNVKYLSFADSSKIEPGQHVVAIGNSLGQYQNTVTSGIISGIGRSIVAGDQQTGSEQLEGVIQTDAAINPGNSGGPLLNLAGQVIGINTAIDQQGQSVGFAIPSNDVKVALDSYEKHGKIIRPYLGVRYVMITDALVKSNKLPKSSGALILPGDTAGDPAVIPGSPADKEGIKANDIILSIQGQQLTEQNSLSKVLKGYNAGDTISMVIFRDGAEKTLSVTLGEAQ